MGRPGKTGWRQGTLLDDGAPPRRALPSEIRLDVVGALAELLLAHLSGDAAPATEKRDEFQDQS